MWLFKCCNINVRFSLSSRRSFIARHSNNDYRRAPGSPSRWLGQISSGFYVVLGCPKNHQVIRNLITPLLRPRDLCCNPIPKSLCSHLFPILRLHLRDTDKMLVRTPYVQRFCRFAVGETPWYWGEWRRSLRKNYVWCQRWDFEKLNWFPGGGKGRRPRV